MREDRLYLQTHGFRCRPVELNAALVKVIDTMPQTLYGESARELSTAEAEVARSGSLVKLSVFSGVLAGMLASITRHTPLFVPVRDWKGQLKKEMVNRRVMERIGARTCVKFNVRKDMYDAIGIGLFVSGVSLGTKAEPPKRKGQ